MNRTDRDIDRLVGGSGQDIVAADDASGAVTALGRWLAERVSGKAVALAANFPFVRRAVAEESVRATAFQNGFIGGVAILVGYVLARRPSETLATA